MSTVKDKTDLISDVAFEKIVKKERKKKGNCVESGGRRIGGITRGVEVEERNTKKANTQFTPEYSQFSSTFTFIFN